MILPVILKILAVIGWILLGILGLIILILLIVLLVPIRYRLQAHGADNLDEVRAEAVVTWLLHLVSIRFLFEHRETETKVRIAWKKLGQDDELSESKDHPEKEEEPEKREEPEEKETEKEGAPAEEEKSSEDDKEAAAEEKAAEHREPVVTKPVSEKKKDKSDKRRKKAKPAKEKKHRFTFDRIYDTINEISDSKERIITFIQSRTHRKVLKRIWKRAVKLVKKLLPRRIEAEGSFGFDEPYTTGLISAFVSTFLPRLGERLKLEPDFEEKILDFDGSISGIIRLGSMVAFALPILLSVDFWRTVKDARELKRKLDRSREVITEGGAA